jgi:CDP-diglyceride synthetase
MIFIPTWITNILFFISCVLAGYQHTRLNRENPINLQFAVVVFSLVMILTGVFYTRHQANAWISLVFFLVAVGVLCVVIRQHRMLPPNKAFE